MARTAPSKRGRSVRSSTESTACAGADGGRQDRGSHAAVAQPHGARGLGRYVGAVRLPAAGAAEQSRARLADYAGWHLLHVLERLAHLAGRPLQRVGLSATVGNPEELRTWLQGPAADRPRQVVAPAAVAAVRDVQLDHVGSIDGAATVISKLH